MRQGRSAWPGCRSYCSWLTGAQYLWLYSRGIYLPRVPTGGSPWFMDFGKNVCWMREIKAPCLLWDPLEPLHFLFKRGHEAVSKLGWAEYSGPILTSGFSSSIVGLQLSPSSSSWQESWARTLCLIHCAHPPNEPVIQIHRERRISQLCNITRYLLSTYYGPDVGPSSSHTSPLILVTAPNPVMKTSIITILPVETLSSEKCCHWAKVTQLIIGSGN